MKKENNAENGKMKVSTIRTVLISLVGVAAVIMFCYTFFAGSQAKHQEKLAAADVFKNFEYETVDGDKFTSEDLAKSKITIVNVWQTTCAPCVSEMPALDQLNKEYDDSEVQIVGLCLDVVPGGTTVDETKRSEEIRILKESGAEFTQILANEKLFHFMESEVIGTPTTFVVDSQGNIIKASAGGREYEGWKQFIEKYTA